MIENSGMGDARPPSTASGEQNIGRRQFLRRVEVAVGIAACGALPLAMGGCAGHVRYVTPMLRDNQLMISVAQLSETGVALVEDPRTELPIYLHRATDGTYTAVSTRCTHRGCQVEPTAEKLVCPCHGSEFTTGGLVVAGPAERPLKSFRVTSDATTVIIHVNDRDTP